MTGSTVVTTAEYSTISNINESTSFDTSFSDRDDMSKHEPKVDCGDFVAPPSCWFESSPVSDVVNTSNEPISVNDSCSLSDLNETTESNKFIPTIAEATTKSSNSSIEHNINVTNPERIIILKTQREDRMESPRKSSQEQSSAGIRNDMPMPKVVVGNTRAAPSQKEIISQVLPAAAKELLSSSMRKLYYTAKLSYSKGRWHRKYSDLGQNAGGFSIQSSSNLELPPHLSELPPFSNLSWIDRQLVQEWRSYLPETPETDCLADAEDFEFEQARTLVPTPLTRPVWKHADVCHTCHKPFGPIRLRHHCRSCGKSFCQDHSSATHRLPHLGYEDVPERVCDSCKRILEEQNLTERIAWRLARCRDLNHNNLTPYFETGVDSVEEVALRVAQAAIKMAKAIPLGAQATVAVETVDVLRKYGLHGIYGIMLRQEFLAAADLLRKALGINKTSWPLSVHELSAALFYALAQHRAMRGLSPEREERIHQFRSNNQQNNNLNLQHDNHLVDDEFETYDQYISETGGQIRTPEKPQPASRSRSFTPVCDPVSDKELGSLLFYAPIALNFIYAMKEVEMQLLAAQQGWRLLYAFLHQEKDSARPCDRPASAIFLHQEHKIVCLSIRGTATINDVITDIRQTPVPFPNMQGTSEKTDDDWTTIDRGKGLALCGMASAAYNLFYEHIDSIMNFVKQGYRVRIVGHSLGGGVATMIGVLVLRHLEQMGYSNETKGTPFEKLLKVYAYGTPSCFDSKLAASVDSFVTTVVLHDDVFPRLTPTSCRGLLKHLLYIRETWVKAHIEEDLRAVGERAKTAWAPRFRQNFALQSSTSSIKKYCKKQILRGKSKLVSPKKDTAGTQNAGEIMGESMQSIQESDPKDEFRDCSEIESIASDPTEWGEKFFVPTTNLSVVDVDEEKVDDSFETDMHEPDGSHTQLLLEFLGGGDNEKEGIIIDGDEFFETEENLVGDSDGEMSESLGDECFSDAIGELADDALIQMSDSWSTDMHKTEISPNKGSKVEGQDDENDATAVVLDESPLPRMFLPGKVVHIYSHRGIYKAAYVPRTFTELRRISMAGNMLSNHTTKQYFESLLEVQTCRAASEAPPKWTAYDEDDTCCCCANRFTWASTSNSQAQEARDKHNCRSCGGLICDPCSKNRVPIPSIGLTVPVRVCDRCYNDIQGGVSAAVSGSVGCALPTPTGYPGESKQSKGTPSNEEKKKPERTRQKRSAVVDDLVSRMRSSALS